MDVVYYKFFHERRNIVHKYAFRGEYVTVRELCIVIMRHNHLDRRHCHVRVYDNKGTTEFVDQTCRVPRNSAVLVKRVPPYSTPQALSPAGEARRGAARDS